MNISGLVGLPQRQMRFKSATLGRARSSPIARCQPCPPAASTGDETGPQFRSVKKVAVTYEFCSSARGALWPAFCVTVFTCDITMDKQRMPVHNYCFCTDQILPLVCCWTASLCPCSSDLGCCLLRRCTCFASENRVNTATYSSAISCRCGATACSAAPTFFTFPCGTRCCCSGGVLFVKLLHGS